MADRTKLIIPILLAIGAGIFLPGIDWGLPSRDVDPFLFGDHPIWTGEQILKLAGPTDDPNRGADVASHQAIDRSRPVVVNGADEDRARIIRRYRLMSYQPDEWVTLKALSEMKPGRGNFDPKLYQYGGLWVYPIGVMLKAASMIHLIEVRPDAAYFLDHPEAFGRYYIVARLWSAVWGMVGIVAVYAIVRRIIGGWMFPTVASLCFISMPIIVNLAHEAKPHLAGAVMMLLAVWAASRYVETGSRKAWLLAGGLCGAAMSMVLTAAPIFIVLPLMVVLRRRSWSALFGAVGVGLAVYAACNPYLLFNLLRHREIVESNLGNTGGMFHPNLTLDGVRNAIYLTEAGMSPIMAIIGAIGAVALARRAIETRAGADPSAIRRRATGLLLAAPALCVACQCICVANARPAEFARFLVVFDIFLMIEGVVAVATFLKRPSLRLTAVSVLLASTVFPGFLYLRAFSRDTHAENSRMIQARNIRHFGAWGDRTLAVFADPAPYCCPPVDLFHWRIVLMPPGADPRDGLAVTQDSVQAVDVMVPQKKGMARWIEATFEGTPISWADKPFDVRTRYVGLPGF